LAPTNVEHETLAFILKLLQLDHALGNHPGYLDPAVGQSFTHEWFPFGSQFPDCTSPPEPAGNHVSPEKEQDDAGYAQQPAHQSSHHGMGVGQGHSER